MIKSFSTQNPDDLMILEHALKLYVGETVKTLALPSFDGSSIDSLHKCLASALSMRARLLRT